MDIHESCYQTKNISLSDCLNIKAAQYAEVITTTHDDFLRIQQAYTTGALAILNEVRDLYDELLSENYQESLDLGEIDPGHTFSDGHMIGHLRGKTESARRIHALLNPQETT